MCGGGGSQAPPPPPPPPVAAPIMYGAKEQPVDALNKKANKVGKARLQIPLDSSPTTGLGIPSLS